MCKRSRALKTIIINGTIAYIYGIILELNILKVSKCWLYISNVYVRSVNIILYIYFLLFNTDERQ